MGRNSGYDFGPSLRKPFKKKEPSELMKKSRKEMKRTRECFVVSMSKTYNKGNRQGDENVSKRETSHVTVVPRTTCSSRPSNRMKSSQENIERSVPSSSRIVQKNSGTSRPSSFKPNNGMGSSNKNVNGGSLSLKNIEKPCNSSSRLDNGEASLSKNTEMPRSSSSRPNKDMVSPPTNTKKPNNGLVPLGRNNESLKSRPSCLRNGSSSVLKDDSNSMFCISKESNPSSMFGNLRIAAQIVNSAAKKEDVPMAIETSNLSINLKGKNLSSRQVTERHAKSMGEHIQLDSRKRIVGLPEDGGTNADKLKRTQMDQMLEEKLEAHDDDDSEVEIRRSKKRSSTKSMDCSIQLNNQNISLVEDGGTINVNLRKRTEPLSGEKPETQEDDDSEEEPENCRPKNRRRLILNDSEDDEDGDQNLAGVEMGNTGLTTQMAVVKDSSIKFSNPVLSESLKLQQYGSLPIDEPIWRGIIKISSKTNFPLAAHLSTKCCEKVWKLAGSFESEIVVTKLARMEAWPESFQASGPTENNIALYFLPDQMRQDADLDQLVKEVAENDMVLQADIGEAEMLIFSSILLPEQHQTFQGKPYLWAVFKRRKNKVTTVEEQKHGKGCSPQDEMGKQQASHCSVGKEVHRVTGVNMDGGLEAPEKVERQGVEQDQNPSLTRANTPSPAAEGPTMNATTSANHGQIHSSLAVPTGALFGFVVQRNPRIEQLIQEMQREGAVVVAMRGEMIGSALGQAVPTGALFGFVVQRNPRIEQLIQEMQREGAVVVAMRGEMIGSALGQAAASGREGGKMPPSSS